MKKSVLFKKLIGVFMSGMIFLVGISSFWLFYMIGQTFGYEDAGKSDYLGSLTFAESLCNTLTQIDDSAFEMASFNIPQSMDEFREGHYENGEIQVGKGKLYGCSWILESKREALGLYTSNSEDGLINVEQEQYPANWYKITMSESKIRSTKEYLEISKQDYISLFEKYAMPNAIYISDLSVNELAALMYEYSYENSWLWDEYELFVVGELGNDETNSVAFGIEEASTSSEKILDYDYTRNGEMDEVNDEQLREYVKYALEAHSDEVLTINSNFSLDCYVNWSNGQLIIYSPESDMFFSEQYGWYSVPETILIPLEYSDAESGFYIVNEEEEYFSIIVPDIFMVPFTDYNSYLAAHIGKNYLKYVQAGYNVNSKERNICYYTVSDTVRYRNVDNPDQIMDCNKYMVIHRNDNGKYKIELYGFENAYLTDSYITEFVQQMKRLQPDTDMYIGIYDTYPYDDVFFEEHELFDKYAKMAIPSLIVGIASVIILIGMMIAIIRNSGRASQDDTQIYLNVFDKWPIEVMVLLDLIGVGTVIIFVGALFHESISIYGSNWLGSMTIEESFILLGYLLSISGFLSLLRRGKAKLFWHQSILRWSGIGIKRLVVAISSQKNLTARTVEVFSIYWMIAIVSIAVIIGGCRISNIVLISIGALTIVGENVVAFVIMLKQAKGEQMIWKMSEEVASGNFEAQRPQGKSLSTESRILDNIEHLSDGVQKAVEKSIYDERMKAELITNVSHDIKTPLTSIINYVDLIKREDIDNEKVNHYIEVLDQKSHRLKQLTEDLVEISKISSGNVTLECMPIDFGELVRQSVGEFEDKFADRDLQIVDSIPDEVCMIYADGRRTFRVMDNLMQNVYKYAMPKTRVYIDLVKKDTQVELAIKNISQAELNINVHELMERFVRGDQSRSTEGSGLGLSIAGDLVRIQEGTFDLMLDGDLFKVIITFPLYESTDNDNDLSEK